MIDIESSVKSLVDRMLASVCTSIPAEVIGVSKYPTECVIDVQPKISDIDPHDLSNMKFPVISDVPVKVYSGGGAVVTVPISVGDIVMLEFSMRGINNWKEGDNEEISTPTDARRFHISDAVAYPCVYQKTNNPNPNPDDLELRYNDTIVRLKKDGNLTISTKGDIIVEEAVNIEVNNSGNLTVNTEGDAAINVTGNTTCDVGGDLSADVSGATTITSGGNVTVDTSSTTITGDLRVDGQVSVGGDVATDAGISHNNHTHTGNLGSPTSPPLP